MEEQIFTYKGCTIRKTRKTNIYDLSWTASVCKKDGSLKTKIPSVEKSYAVFCRELNAVKDKIISDGGFFFNVYGRVHGINCEDLNEDCVKFAVSSGIPTTILLHNDDVRIDFESIRPFKSLLMVGVSINERFNTNPSFVTLLFEKLSGIGIECFAVIEYTHLQICQSLMSCIARLSDALFLFVPSHILRSKTEKEAVMEFVTAFRNDDRSRVGRKNLSLFLPASLDSLIDATPSQEDSDKSSSDNSEIEQSCEADNRETSLPKSHREDSEPRVSSRFANPIMMSSVKAYNEEVVVPPMLNEQMFSEFVKNKVACRLEKFSKQENFFVAFAPLIIGELAWIYAFRALDLSAKYKVSILKKLSRSVKGLREMYLLELKRDLHARGIEKIKGYADLLFSEFSHNFMILYLSVDSDVQTMMPECSYKDMRTEAMCSFLMLELLMIYNVKVDSLTIERIGEHDGFRSKKLDALRSSMEAFIYPDSLKFSDNSLMAAKIIFNKLYEKSFSWCESY